MDPGEFSRQQEIEILTHFSKITSITNLDQVLQQVVQETPRLLSAAGCSVYLLPEYVPRYTKKLLQKKIDLPHRPQLPFHRDEYQEIDAAEIACEFVVLAANSRPNSDVLLGKAFSCTGVGITGWVFKHRQALLLYDMSDPAELRAVAPDLNWHDGYGGSADYYREDEPKPILAVPLIIDGEVKGVLKILGPRRKATFSDSDLHIATITGQVISGVIRQTWTVREQENAILRLIEMGAHKDPDTVAQAATERLMRLLNCGRCELYLRDPDSLHVARTMVNGRRADEEPACRFARGQDLIGWVYKTGKPLNLPDARPFVHGVQLDDLLLEEISDDSLINLEDRWLCCERACAGSPEYPLPFLAVPVLSEEGAVWGVLTANSLGDERTNRLEPFTRAELQLAQWLAYTIGLSIENEYDHKLNQLIINLAYIWDPDRLFNAVIQQVPYLIPGTDCSIYVLREAYEGKRLHLIQSSQNGARDFNGRLMEIGYALGEGKAGFCAQAETTLLLNHFGWGEAAVRAIQNKLAWINDNHPEDLVEALYDDQGEVIGLTQLFDGKDCPPIIREQFRNHSRDWIYQRGQGLISTKANSLHPSLTTTSWSIMSVPVIERNTGLAAVINVWRHADPTPFTYKDITLVTAVSARLAAVLSNLKLQEQRRNTMMTLAHEINTPMTGMLADAENLMNETHPDSELHHLSRHSLDQVQRLHMQTETIMVVLSDQNPVREFTIHSIYRPLLEARELFKSEATYKHCDILRPRSIGGPFPNIEMSLLDLSIAFKNIIHNAVKYSFRPPAGQEGHRYVRIICRWADREKILYKISIQNYGVGISSEEIEKRLIFQPYYRGERATDRRRTGAGFGLAHARQVIEDLHHGHIDVESVPMGGGANLTTFHILLPLRQPKKA